MAPRLLQSALLGIVLLGLHAAPAFALTEAQLREAVADDIPEEAKFAAWPGVADRTLIAWTDYRSMTAPQVDGGDIPSGPTLPDVLDLTVLVVQTSTGHVMQRYHEDKAYDSVAVQFLDFEFDTADYALAPGSRAFGVRMLGRHLGYAAEDTATLHLLEPAGTALREVLTLQTMAHLATRDCGEGHDIARTVAIGKASTQGHADLIVHERREETPDGSSAPTRCHPKVRRSERTTTLRFDGERYPGSGR